jgi:hypothetical protein
VYNRRYRNSAPFVMIAVAAMLLHSSLAAAQQTRPGPSSIVRTEASAVQQNVPARAQNTEDAVERAVKRFGIGVEGGIALDPELIAFGAHATFGPIFRPNLQFRPGVEFGVGEVTTAFGINLDVLYTLPGATGQARWRPYVGAGPNFSLSHRGFDSTTDEDGNRFDFGDTDFEAGFNFIAGVRNPNRTFLEMRATAYGVSNVRLLVGFAF